MNAVGTCVHPRTGAMPLLDIAHWHAGVSLEAFIEHAQVNKELWQAMLRLGTLEEDARAAAAAITRPLRLLTIVEDWCGDAINTVAIIQKLVDANPLLEMRVIARDEHDDLMSLHLTGRSRSIPVVIVYDETGVHHGWWGPRPSALQDWVLGEGSQLEKSERYKLIRTWYARDKGRTTVREVLTLMEEAATGVVGG